jgi:hypothetical protein
VIRNYTRWWLEERIDSGDNIEKLCTDFSLETDLFTRLHVLFNHAIMHVERSINEYED